MLSAAYGQASPACKTPDKYTAVLHQVPLRVTHASLNKRKTSAEPTPATNQAQASNSSSSTGFTGVPDMQQQMQQFMVYDEYGYARFPKTKKALRTLLDIKTPEKQQETTTETQQVEKEGSSSSFGSNTGTSSYSTSN